ncbi:hypothetical protein C495_14662 [Natronorubrum sulfidifaciens JCM 14089]|uniref:Uncharacterized protein n=1 Tax=Natronorubrum sulfidifaciens JCM 14089 TaxID=1230460 RepID=L9VZC8_9EURY|nr:hypothetical protein C495_14662 [Natronorubrum sulfidifaciens JCM 14089]
MLSVCDIVADDVLHSIVHVVEIATSSRNVRDLISDVVTNPSRQHFQVILNAVKGVLSVILQHYRLSV